MHCHILVPGLFRPQFDGGAALPRALALETLLARGRRRFGAAASTGTWLMKSYAVARQRDWPVAPLALLGEGGAPGSDYWVRADPAHLRIHGDRLLLADAGAFHLSRVEAEALVESLNSHFSEVFRIFPVQPNRWYAKLAAAPELRTTPLEDARGQSLNEILPQGTEAVRWHALMNEIQMLLHQHPVNAVRERQGEAPVNAMWFWGAGALPAVPTAPFQHVIASDPLARGLALASGIPAHGLPDSPQAWLDSNPDSGRALVVLDALSAPAAYGDFQAWRQALEEMERCWFAPLLAALRQGRIGMLTLQLVARQAQLHIETTRSDLRYFWRRREPLAAYLAAPGDE